MTVTTGIIAALTAPLLEAAGFLEWDIHWKVGHGSAFALNLYKCNIAALAFFILAFVYDDDGDLFSWMTTTSSSSSSDNDYEHYQQQQQPRPYFRNDRMEAMTVTNVSHLMLSSFLGILIGDLAELEALRLVGARRVLIVDTIKPFAAAVLGHVVLGEAIRPAAIVGIVLTAYGVYLVLRMSIETMESDVTEEAVKMRRQQGGSKKSLKSSGSVGTMGTMGSFGSLGSMGSFSNMVEEGEEMIVFSEIVKRQMSRHSLFTEYEGMVMEVAERVVDELGDVDDDSSTGSWDEGTPFMWKEDSAGLDMDDHSDSSDENPNPNPKKYENNDVEKGTQTKIKPHQHKSLFTGSDTPTTSPNIISQTNNDDNYYDNNSTTTPRMKNTDSNNNNKPFKNKSPPKTNNRKKLQRSLSTDSVGSIHSECGPPPGYYPYLVNGGEEQSWQRQMRLKKGYSLALLNVLLDAYGSMLTKQYGAQMTTWEINLIRLGFAGAVMLVISVVMRIRHYLGGDNGSNDRRRRNHNNSGSTGGVFVPWYCMPQMSWGPWMVVSMGVFFVTFLCPALSNYALFEISLALAVTLCSVTPLYTLPLMWLLKSERPSRKSCMGAFLAVLGVIVLCIWGMDPQQVLG